MLFFNYFTCFDEFSMKIKKFNQTPVQSHDHPTFMSLLNYGKKRKIYKCANYSINETKMDEIPQNIRTRRLTPQDYVLNAQAGLYKNRPLEEHRDLWLAFTKLDDATIDYKVKLQEELLGMAKRDRSLRGTAVVVEPSDAIPARYNLRTGLRVSPDILRFRSPDGIWYFANGVRDEERSPKQDLTKLLFH